jgi:hypothetical protein
VSDSAHGDGAFATTVEQAQGCGDNSTFQSGIGRSRHAFGLGAKEPDKIIIDAVRLTV